MGAVPRGRVPGGDRRAALCPGEGQASSVLPPVPDCLLVLQHPGCPCAHKPCTPVPPAPDPSRGHWLCDSPCSLRSPSTAEPPQNPCTGQGVLHTHPYTRTEGCMGTRTHMRKSTQSGCFLHVHTHTHTHIHIFMPPTHTSSQPGFLSHVWAYTHSGTHASHTHSPPHPTHTHSHITSTYI